eukprot:TRINITY_DN17999_c0_g1_i13.p1 TRINITY_DN17999_c0_g1~~TRINITY_DN17999_c0_g1_i13.p1  ORF type:complete len:415 (+),score=65.57 TRINITY_DN17999_c0_g1_i13:301-1545(+)
MGLKDLFIAASIPVLKLLIVTGVGSFIATGRVDILGEAARKHLNNVTFFVFNPAFVYTNLSKTITFESMVMLWFMPLNILITFGIGITLGWVLIQITKAPSHLRGLILGCSSAGNLGNILIIIIPAICKEKGSPFGAPDVCHTYGLAYASLSMAIGAIFLWSLVYNIIRISSSGSTRDDAMNGSSDETSKLLPRDCTRGSASTKDTSIYERLEDQHAPSFENSKELIQNPKVPFSIKQFLKKILGHLDLKKLLAPSTIGVIVGFVVGVIPLIRMALIGESAPLRVIQDSAALLGEGAIPAVSLVMGGNLLRGLRGSEIKVSLIIGMVVIRYIILPLLGIVIIKGAIHLGLVHSDPLYQFILLLQYTVPPAMNIGTITQLFGAGESECSVIFLWMYALASVSLTLWSTFFMWLVS